MKQDISFQATTRRFPGYGGWVYVDVPKKYRADLETGRGAWGMYPIEVQVGKTVWKTKLMTKKGGEFFVALKASVREKEKIAVGDAITASLRLL